MKRTLTHNTDARLVYMMVLLLLIPLLGISQNSHKVDMLFSKYGHKEGIESFKMGYIPLKLAGFFCRLTGSSNEADLL